MGEKSSLTHKTKHETRPSYSVCDGKKQKRLFQSWKFHDRDNWSHDRTEEQHQDSATFLPSHFIAALQCT